MRGDLCYARHGRLNAGLERGWSGLLDERAGQTGKPNSADRRVITSGSRDLRRESWLRLTSVAARLVGMMAVGRWALAPFLRRNVMIGEAIWGSGLK